MRLSLAHLPETARDLVELIGLPATLRLVEGYRGQRIQIAKGLRAKGCAQIQEIAERIGLVAAKKLSRRYGGDILPVPKCQAALLATRDARLQARFDELTAASYSARRAVTVLVTEFNLVESSVWRALKRPAGEAAITAAVADDQQLGLF